MATGQGRTGATALVLSAALLLFPVVQSDYGTFDVGGDAGWSFGVDRWAKGKTFKVGDQLMFKYKPRSETVAVVDADGYTACKAKEDSKVYTSGYDGATLEKGSNYFISTLQGSCQGGVKLNITTA